MSYLFYTWRCFEIFLSSVLWKCELMLHLDGQKEKAPFALWQKGLSIPNQRAGMNWFVSVSMRHISIVPLISFSLSSTMNILEWSSWDHIPSTRSTCRKRSLQRIRLHQALVFLKREELEDFLDCPGPHHKQSQYQG